MSQELISDVGFVDTPFFTKDEETLINMIDCIYQPIYNTSTKSIFAYMAFLSPKFCTVYSLISQLKEDRQLHLLEKISRYKAIEYYRKNNITVPVFIKTISTENLTEFERDYLKTNFNYQDIEIYADCVEFGELSLANLKVKQRRYPLCITNFGQGIWNSTKCIQALRPTFIKLGYKFTYNIAKDEVKQKDFIALKQYIEAQNISIIATEIELAEDFNWLEKNEVKFMSGYYIDNLLAITNSQQSVDDCIASILSKYS